MICIRNSKDMINPNEKAKVDGTNQVTITISSFIPT